MARLTNGKIIVEVPDEKAGNYALIMGYRIMDDEPEKQVEQAPKPKRGRPPKKAE